MIFMTNKPIPFNPLKFIDGIPSLIDRIMGGQKVRQLTEKQALDIVQLQWWTNPIITQDHALVLQLYMLRAILPIDLLINGIGCELNKIVCIESIQTYRYTLLEYYRRKFKGEL